MFFRRIIKPELGVYMKKPKLIVLALLLTSVSVFGWVGVSRAHDFRTGTNVAIDQGETINQSVFAAGQTVTINSEVFGDVFCAGQTVTVSGTIHGDVICAGQTVTVSGKVLGDVRLAGQTVSLNADVAGNATIAGQTFTLDSAGKIAGDLSLGSDSAMLNGNIGRDLAVGGTNVTLAGLVGRDVKGTMESLTLNSSANIAGNVNYTSNQDLNKLQGATVTGTVTRSDMPQKAKPKRGAVFGFSMGWFLYWLAALALAYLALILMFPRLFHAVTGNALPTPWKALVVGFLANITAPVLFVLLLVTVIGIPLAFIAGTLWLGALLLSAPVFSYYIGRLMLRDSTNPLLIMLAGLGIVLVAWFIPILGVLAVLATLWIGTGMILLEIFKRTPRPSYNLARETPKAKSKA